MKTISKLFLFGSCIVAATAAFVAISAQSVENLQGKMLPAFTMTDLNGKKITSQSLRGKVVLIDLWATWCGPCQKASPVMQSLHNKYGGRGLVVIGANTWENNDKTGANARKYRDQHKYTYLFTYNNDDLAKAAVFVVKALHHRGGLLAGPAPGGLPGDAEPDRSDVLYFRRGSIAAESCFSKLGSNPTNTLLTLPCLSSRIMVGIPSTFQALARSSLLYVKR